MHKRMCFTPFIYFITQNVYNETQYKYDGHIVYKACLEII